MFRGALVPNLTFFAADGALDLETTRRHMRWLLEKGVNGLFLTGTYGAGPLMTLEERVAVFGAAKQVAADFPGCALMAHVGCIDTRSTLDLGQAAAALGMDAISAIPPYYYKHSEDAVIDFYHALREAVTIPLFAYNNPEVARFAFTLGTVRKLQALGLEGMKDSLLDVGFVSTVYYEARLAGRAFQLIVGSSKGWLPFHAMGIEAMIAGMANWAPEIITALVEATQAGDSARAERIYVTMMELSRKAQVADSTIASHMALFARGMGATESRRPLALPSFGDPRYQQLRDALQSAFSTLALPLEADSERLGA